LKKECLFFLRDFEFFTFDFLDGVIAESKESLLSKRWG